MLKKMQSTWSERKSTDGFMELTLGADGPGRVEVSQLFLYILKHPERFLILR